MARGQLLRSRASAAGRAGSASTSGRAGSDGVRGRGGTGRAATRPRRWWRWGLPLAGTAVLLVAWQLAASAYRDANPHTSAGTFPVPLTIASTLVNMRSGFLSALSTTLRGAVAGLAVGILIATIVSLGAVSTRWLEDTIYPYLVASQMVPTIVLAPIVLAVVMNGTAARVIVAAYVSFFVIAVNMTKGLKSVEPDKVIFLRSIRARRWQYYTKLRLPACLPFFFAGLKVAAPLSVVGEIVVELTGSQNGLGLVMINSLDYGGSQLYVFWGSVVLTAALGYALFVLATLLERRLTPWQPEFRGAG
jgi:NitT/TauT family transport system permease protein